MIRGKYHTYQTFASSPVFFQAIYLLSEVTGYRMCELGNKLSKWFAFSPVNTSFTCQVSDSFTFNLCWSQILFPPWYKKKLRKWGGGFKLCKQRNHWGQTKASTFMGHTRTSSFIRASQRKTQYNKQEWLCNVVLGTLVFWTYAHSDNTNVLKYHRAENRSRKCWFKKPNIWVFALNSKVLVLHVKLKLPVLCYVVVAVSETRCFYLKLIFDC